MMLGKYVQNLKSLPNRYCGAVLVAFLSLLSMASPSFAQDVTTVTNNIGASIRDLPLLVTWISYLLGLLFGVRGILQLKKHVENPGDGAGQTPLRKPIISLIIGGALFSLPMVYEAAVNTISGGATGGLGFALSTVIGSMSTLFGGLGFAAGTDVNSILINITSSIRGVPGLISGAAYLLGCVLIVMGLIKVKEHVNTPEQVKVSEGVIRLLTGGALLTLPTIYNAMFNSIDGTGGILAGITSIFGATGFLSSGYITGTCGGVVAGSTGDLICGIITHTGAFPAFLTAISYVFGLVFGVWGILKVRDHVLNPQQTTIFEGVSRFMAGGAFFALPVIIEVMKNTLTGGPTGTLSAILALLFSTGGGGFVTGYNTGSIGACPATAGLSLDAMLICFTNDILTPMHTVLSFFAFVAGIIFIMIGISRLIKGAQEGAKAPGGLGTMMTFVIGGALISYNDLMRAATTTFTGNSVTNTFATMAFTTGLTGPEVDAAHAVISSIVKFMIVIGIISFVRGLFIVRSVAEGNQQASMMAGVTHIIGGTLAVNIGPVLNAVQATLGTTGFGVAFT